MKRDALSTGGEQLNVSPFPICRNGTTAAGGARIPSATAAPVRATALPSSGFMDGDPKVPLTWMGPRKANTLPSLGWATSRKSSFSSRRRICPCAVSVVCSVSSTNVRGISAPFSALKSATRQRIGMFLSPRAMTISVLAMSRFARRSSKSLMEPSFIIPTISPFALLSSSATDLPRIDNFTRASSVPALLITPSTPGARRLTWMPRPAKSAMPTSVD